MDWKSFFYGVFSVVLLLLIMISFGTAHIGSKSSGNENFNGNVIDASSSDSATNDQYNDIPEKCRPPAGQDINSWKEHLGHHAETKDCLKYF